MSRLTVDDIVGVVGILPTPSKPGSDSWAAKDTVDLDETARMTDAIVSAGTDVILTNGTFGEGASLTWDELQAFVDVVVQTVAHRVPVFAGATTLNTRDTVERARRLQEIGADCLFLGRPMWIALDAHGIVQYHRDIAEAVPDMSQVVYDNPSAFKGKVPTVAYQELAKIPQIVASKQTGLANTTVADFHAVNGAIRLLPTDESAYYVARLFPDWVKAFWSGNVACGPAPLIALRNALVSQDWDTAAAITDELEWVHETFFPHGSFEEFSKYNIQLDRAKFEGAGFIKAGPARAPYTYAPEDYLEGARETGRRWATLQEKYAATPAHR